MSDYDFILASASPRRSEILQQAGFSFKVIASGAEELHTTEIATQQLCAMNACLKAWDIASKHADMPILAADTLVYYHDRLLGKPADGEQARAMLRQLSAQWHNVATGMCLYLPDGNSIVRSVVSRVKFKQLDEATIETYLGLVHTLDKAGGYAIQHHSELIIERFEGSYSNIVGLPAKEVSALLHQYLPKR